MENDSLAMPGTNNQASESVTVQVVINYLRWLATEGILGQHPLNSDMALEWFCATLPHRPLIEVLKARYLQIANYDTRLSLVPVDKMLMEKVFIPLHQAKVAYVLGHELACIALSGMASEMLATLRFQMSTYGSGSHKMAKTRQERLFGNTFERIDHSRRVGVLELLNLIDAETGDYFREIAKIRNAYLHRISHSHEEMSRDAKRSYQLVAELAARILGIEIKDGKAVVRQELIDLLQRPNTDSEHE